MAIRKIKEIKATGLDGIPGKVWKYEREEVREWLGNFCRRMWKGEGWPEDWKEEKIILIVKKGEGTKVEEYRRVTLLSTAYKIYATILAKKLRKKMEEKKVLSSN